MSEGPRGGQDSPLPENPPDGPAPAGPGDPASAAPGDPAARADEAAPDQPEGAAPDRPDEAPDRPDGAPDRPDGAAPAQPAGDTYAWYQRGIELLRKRSPAAAAQLLERASDAEPQSRMVREALARAQFDAGWYSLAVQNFRMIVEASPADDYAHFGLGLALARTGEPGQAAEYLALAAAMRPDLPHYSAALRDVRATLRARAGQPGQDTDNG